ncbi:class III lanthionine synthetase LanKC [Phytohabitans sp. ZYX-F-186]|uniref:Class III lanthionine synthetase LanKC n=1 Tax=Phytohabitans maris TaxID=3071409 RepID=A0ABU0ZHE4_9ACTN|nr:class III lanthionine synthetase LanKC [Phytohabitans sp. ZYX-F-186]MDQ7906430.1 class III lanthionine synthetase LanKC [Phytohabitans sp. ZYX-F-186]
MDDRYEAFCMASPLFYDALHSTRKASFRTAERALPAGWSRHERDDWWIFSSGRDVPAQGWKIHVSATLGNADWVLDTVWDYCVPRGVDFKFLRSPSALLARVSKYAPRGYSGKLVTIYPVDDGACHTVLRELGDLLDGAENPYILSDLRWGAGPLHVRYGAFTSRFCVGPDGTVVPAIADPTGTLVPDRRAPVFHVPQWVTLPDFLAPHLAARNAVSVADLPYTIERVLHFSNGGGIYAGTEKATGRRVVLKEGRPHAGIDARGDDAVRRVEREYDVLRRLAGIPGVPEALDLFSVGEHRFLAMEHVDGTPLNKAVVRRYPLVDADPGPDAAAEYARWALRVHAQVERTVHCIHQRGIVYGDMHMFNVLVTEEGETYLVDYEVAAPVEEATRPALGNQGFSPPRGTTGFDVDRYGLACLRFALFLPLSNMTWLHRPVVRRHAEVVAEHFPVPRAFLDEGAEVIAPGAPPPPPWHTDWPRLRDDLARAILASATPDRDDRLFPGDIEQFGTGGGLNLAYGAAGVLYALSVTGAGRHPELERWLLRKVAAPESGTPLGLYDGLHGAAFVLDHLGHRQPALDTVDLCLREDWERLGLDLRGGLAGIGLNLLHLADHTGEPALRVAAHRAAELTAERLGTVDSVPATSGGANPYAGLMRGSAGAALLLLRAYDDTGDRGYLDAAAVALRQDLRRCVTRDGGELHVDEGWRTMPYLDVGSVGIGLVLDEYLARHDDGEFAAAVPGIERAAQSTMYILPGLFSGRAGILLYLVGHGPDRGLWRSGAGREATSPDRTGVRGGSERSEPTRTVSDPLVAKQVRNLGWHALPYGGGFAFPGTALMRLSMDLATGTAGVLLALGAALHGEPVHLPLLHPSAWSAPDAAAPRTPAPGRWDAAAQSPAPTGAGQVTPT